MSYRTLSHPRFCVKAKTHVGADYMCDLDDLFLFGCDSWDTNSCSGWRWITRFARRSHYDLRLKSGISGVTCLTRRKKYEKQNRQKMVSKLV